MGWDCGIVHKKQISFKYLLLEIKDHRMTLWLNLVRAGWGGRSTFGSELSMNLADGFFNLIVKIMIST
jgi:hypothetical protein